MQWPVQTSITNKEYYNVISNFFQQVIAKFYETFYHLSWYRINSLSTAKDEDFLGVSQELSICFALSKKIKSLVMKGTFLLPVLVSIYMKHETQLNFCSRNTKISVVPT